MKKVIKNTTLIILFLVLSASAAYLAYMQFFMSGDKELSGEWTTKLDMTERAAVTALGWLQEIEAVSVSLEEMEAYMGDLTVQVNLVFEQTEHSGGVFYCNVLPESYDACRQAAYEAFARAFRDLLAKRLRMAGYEDGTDQETIEALVIETFGMSTVSYLMSCGPGLLPSLEELQAEYDGGGTYETLEGILTRQFDADGSAATRAERYIRQDFDLLLIEEVDSAGSDVLFDPYPVRYTLQQPQQ